MINILRGCSFDFDSCVTLACWQELNFFFGNFENHDLPKKSQTRESKVDIYFSRNFDFQLFDSIVSLSNFQVPRSMSHETFLLTILRYCDKKIISSHVFQWPTKVSSEKHTLIYFCLNTLIYFFVMRLPWPLEIQKMTRHQQSLTSHCIDTNSIKP